MGLLNMMRLTVQMMVTGSVLGLLLVLPQITAQHHAMVQACEVLMGEGQKAGMVTSSSYAALWTSLENLKLSDQVMEVEVQPGLDLQVQKRMPMSIRLRPRYMLQIPFYGPCSYLGEPIVVQAFSHKYFK